MLVCVMGVAGSLAHTFLVCRLSECKLRCRQPCRLHARSRSIHEEGVGIHGVYGWLCASVLVCWCMC